MNHPNAMSLLRTSILFTGTLFCLSLLARIEPSPDEVFAYKETPQGKLFLHTYFPENWKKEEQTSISTRNKLSA